MKEFVTAVAEVVEPDGGIQFKIDGYEITAYKPGDGQVVMMMASLGRRGTTADKVAGIIDFLDDILDDDSSTYIARRLHDRNDAFGIEEVQAVLEYLMEEWAGRPTKLPSDFAPSQKTGGQKSTRRTSVST